ncbi:type IV secretory system conjugative DNA transfer family protein [Mesorhizobium sp. M0902]|uniref:type IV secretory system conjugative DNA transfer family protein n=1 Tax=Mesorhizobium sp. M0902 TaxID=2957021 RepID=UPI00333784B3
MPGAGAGRPPRSTWTITARALMTPGEIMQLPPTDAIVMISGQFPIRAKKARYFADQRLAERVLPPPKAGESMQNARSDDWTGTTVFAEPEGNPQKSWRAKDQQDDDPANGGIRRQPELPEHEDIAPERTTQRDDEFDLDRDEPDDDAMRRRGVDQAMRRAARQAALDPSDGIEL